MHGVVVLVRSLCVHLQSMEGRSLEIDEISWIVLVYLLVIFFAYVTEL